MTNEDISIIKRPWARLEPIPHFSRPGTFFPPDRQMARTQRDRKIDRKSDRHTKRQTDGHND